MKKAVIEFSGYLTVYPDGDEYEGESMTLEEARGWVSHAMARGDKHAGNYWTSAGADSLTFEDYDPDE
ncbi:hypothetical protein [Streptomyces sp. SID2119]|uniref:hypothetical protein n=1 Tax=Streptomyces sp. SID2119 TaxID=2690253 RepID=UPI00136A065E|nr:hypothetical protein [Streptomyces sp. SID2119]MYW28350.1 hypothetical protein [Streptomyces sp. SID2119]